MLYLFLRNLCFCLIMSNCALNAQKADVKHFEVIGGFNSAISYNDVFADGNNFNSIGGLFTTNDGDDYINIDMSFDGISMDNITPKVYVLTEKNSYFHVKDFRYEYSEARKKMAGIWKSVDCGKTWMQLLNDNYIVDNIWFINSNDFLFNGFLREDKDTFKNIFGSCIGGKVQLSDMLLPKDTGVGVREVRDVSILSNLDLVILAEKRIEPRGDFKMVLIKHNHSDSIEKLQKEFRVLPDRFIRQNSHVLEFVNDEKGIIYGDSDCSSCGVEYTNDGGKTWVDLEAPSASLLGCYWKNKDEIIVADKGSAVGGVYRDIVQFDLQKNVSRIMVLEELCDIWKEPNLSAMPLRSQRGVHVISLLARYSQLGLPKKTIILGKAIKETVIRQNQIVVPQNQIRSKMQQKRRLK